MTKVDGWYNDDPAQDWNLPEPEDILIADEVEIVPLDEASLEDYPSVILDEHDHPVEGLA